MKPKSAPNPVESEDSTIFFTRIWYQAVPLSQFQAVANQLLNGDTRFLSTRNNTRGSGTGSHCRRARRRLYLHRLHPVRNDFPMRRTYIVPSRFRYCQVLRKYSHCSVSAI